MSAQGIIVILLSIIGFLIVSWFGIAAMWIKDKLANHEERIDALEDINEKSFHQSEEILRIVRGLSNVG